VFPRPAVGRLSVFSFFEGLSHGTVLVQALAEEVPAGPAAQIDTRSPGRSYGSQFSARGRVPGRCPSPLGHAVIVAGEAFGASVHGLAAQVIITLAESGLDRLTANALDSDDILIGGLGQNVLDAAPGDDTVIQ